MTESKLRAQGHMIEDAIIAQKPDLYIEDDYNCLMLKFPVVGIEDSWGCNYGACSLGYADFYHGKFKGNAKGEEAIMSILYTVGVWSIDDLAGKPIRVAWKNGGIGSDTIYAIGNATKDRWFCYEEFFK